MSDLKNSSICLTVDVEEYFHAANLSHACPIKSWHSLPSTIENNTHRLLDIYDLNNSKGTFFILGYSAKRFPNLVKEIKNRGHEIASHGYAHKIAYLQSPKQFFQDIDRSKKLLEDISGVQVRGYRAPNFSITKKNLWAYDSLMEAGFLYDSSLNPVSHPRYSNLNRATTPEFIEKEGKRLLILPLTTLQLPLMKFRVPIAGGAYWRLYPLQLTLKALTSKTINTNYNPICYLHPWEIDTNQPYFANLSPSNKFRHYYGVSKFKNKISEILKSFKSKTLAECYLENREISYSPLKISINAPL
jgi:polysaccharide deacetylase family protein (PEP-CTERM system associated)